MVIQPINQQSFDEFWSDLSIGLVRFVWPKSRKNSFGEWSAKAYLELIQNSLMLMRRRWNELTILSPEECLDYNLITITIDEEMIQIIRRRKRWQMIKWCFKRWRWRFSSLLSRRLVPLAAPSLFLSGVIWTLIPWYTVHWYPVHCSAFKHGS